MKKFDYLVVGSGLYGAIFAHEAKAHGSLHYPLTSIYLLSDKLNNRPNIHNILLFFYITLVFLFPLLTTNFCSYIIVYSKSKKINKTP